MSKALCPEEVIKAYNKKVVEYLLQFGTYELTVDGRILKTEIDRYDRDGKPDGFVGWWDDDHSVMTFGRTPYEVYNDSF